MRANWLHTQSENQAERTRNSERDKEIMMHNTTNLKRTDLTSTTSLSLSFFLSLCRGRRPWIWICFITLSVLCISMSRWVQSFATSRRRAATRERCTTEQHLQRTEITNITSLSLSLSLSFCLCLRAEISIWFITLPSMCCSVSCCWCSYTT